MTRPEGDPLTTYRAKRDFSVTPEPKGKGTGSRAPRTGNRFVVQRHRARRLHYDFRLEVDGALASWAVPKGPTLDPAARRAAFHVEDHPIEYLDFEGVIPAGQYGAGDVIVWDRGTWDPVGTDDPAAAIARGEIHFDLHGERLRGRFVLVRTSSDSRGRERWLLLHKHDEAAVPGWDAEAFPTSVKSGRTNDEVAAAPEALWRSDLPANEAEIRLGSTDHHGTPRRSPATPRRFSSAPKKPSAWKGPTKAELDALDALGDNGRWSLQDHEVKLTNLNKVLFPGSGRAKGITKRELVRYYALVAPTIIPFLADRPVNMHRYPNGVDQPGFWHKQIPSYAPDWLTRWHDPHASPGKSDVYPVVDRLASLVWMANFAAVELHPWTARATDVDHPTWAYIDIDPGTKTSFEEVLVLARLFRTGLDHLGVFAMPKLTGSRGVHIWIPIEPRYTFRETSAWVEKLSRAVGATVPDLVSWTWHKSDRQGLARLDYTQNASNKTLVAPYSVRPRPGAPVSVPLEWDELDEPGLRSDRFSIGEVPQRLATAGDPFERLVGYEQRLPEL